MTTVSPWKELAREADRLRDTHLRELFRDDPDRFARFTATLDDLTIDFSKERIDGPALAALLDLAHRADVSAKRDAMLSGARVNVTEDRAALHTALRAGPDASTEVDGVRVAAAVHETLEWMLGFAEEVRAGKQTGSAGAPFLDVVNIGIGGSDLGPDMATRALAPDADGPRLHFVSNVDGAHLADTLKGLEPARTLFVIVSKTFTTAETMANARSAHAWLSEALGEENARQHFAAVSTNLEATAAFGIDDSRVFGFWDWVGGRYSVWSAVGLSVAIAVGAQTFRALLDGARAMDVHFAAAPLDKNLPVLLALIAVWRRNAMGWPTVALIPYDQRLARFPAYVQQLDMESNGKRVTVDGQAVGSATAPVIWGEPGTNAQHSFFQLLHQGTDVIPVDFIVAAQPREHMGRHHALLLANCLAQSQALAFGKTEDEVRADMAAKGETPEAIAKLAAHRTFPGNRPSTVILYKQLDAYALGRLIALYEHKVFVQGAIWGVDSYDQWGVELGKELATRLVPLVESETVTDDLDGSTAGLVDRIRNLLE
jgi:glucose-6-phosphate isomerase